MAGFWKALAPILCVATFFDPGSARADDATSAQVLFDDAKRLMDAHDYVNACPKLEESLRLQSAGGTVLYLALCEEADGKTASAWTRFNEALSASRRDGRPDREKVAEEHLATLTPKLAKITISLDAPVASTPGVEVKCDGASISKALWGTAVPADPGGHDVIVTAPGKRAWAKHVDLSAVGVSVSVEVPALEDGPVTSATPADVAASTDAPAAAPRKSSQRVIGAVVAGIGLVGIGVGAGFGISALSKKSDANAFCPGGASGPCSSDGVTLSHDAVRAGNVSTIAFGVGAAFLVAGGILWFTAPKTTSSSGFRVAPTIGREGAGLALSGNL